jgi:hypothetical protein
MSHQPIHVQIWSPLDKSIFKFPAQDPAECTVFYCDKADTCQLLKRGQCINKLIWGPKCPHGYVRQENGPTKKSKNCASWVAEKRKEFSHLIGKVQGTPPHKIAEVGDWIYIPYAHVDMNKDLPIERHSSLFVSGTPFLRKESFTIPVIQSIVNFRPMSLMGGEITSYQKEEIPKFLIHLEEAFPDLYNQLLDTNPHYVTRYNLVKKSYVGRTALLKTTKAATLQIGKHTFEWNGNVLTSLKFDPLWIDVKDQNGCKAIEQINVSIVPTDTATIKIESNDQVSPDTVFVD